MRAGPFMTVLLILFVTACISIAHAQPARPGPTDARAALTIVAAENVYGDVAAQIAGPDAQVTSVLSSPDQDPHLFETSPSTARAVAAAQIVVYNGVGYDPWMAKLVGATRSQSQTQSQSQSQSRQVLIAGELMQRRDGVNPHLWYDPAVMPAVARALADALAMADPAHAADYARRLQSFLASLKPIDDKIASMRARFAGQAVTATEPVAGYLTDAIGLVPRNERFQRAVMNQTEPRVSDVAAFEASLKSRQVRALMYNSQSTGPMAQRMGRIAMDARIPVVSITETLPRNTTYQAWMMSVLDELDAALSAAP